MPHFIDVVYKVFDEDQMASDFVGNLPSPLTFSFDVIKMGFLENFVKVFPHLAKRPLHLTGESYAGMYIVGDHHCSSPPFVTCFIAIHNQGLFRDGEPPCKFSKDSHR